MLVFSRIVLDDLLLLQEKPKMRVKEKFDKCNKEKLLEFCDLLDIPVAKATTKKVNCSSSITFNASILQ